MNTSTSPPLADAERPWIGLRAFEEAAREFFAGRATEAEELFRLVRRDSLTLLYGVSGLGKTSLVQAGLFPRLREAGALPVSVRLTHGDDAPPLAEQVHRAILLAASEAHVEAPATQPGETLWEYFHRLGNDFWSDRNAPVAPVLVLDQFEELFTLGRETSERIRRGADFVAELADLVENRAPAGLKSDPALAAAFDFSAAPVTVLLSMREDYLPELDRLRDHFRAIAQNRLRLLPMSIRQAREVIALGRHLLAPGAAESILGFVAGQRAATAQAPCDDADEECAIAPALLSLVCRELNEKRLLRAAPLITPDLLDVDQPEILRDFYERCVADLPPAVRTFVEDELLTPLSDFRDTRALDDALSTPGVTREAIERLVERRLLSYEDRHRTRRIELTHDVLIPVIRASRDTRHLREAELRAEAERHSARQQARRSRLFAALGIAAALTAIVAGVAWQKALAAKRETLRARQDTDNLLGWVQSDLYGKLLALGRPDVMLDVLVGLRHYHQQLAEQSGSAEGLRSYHATINLRGDILLSLGRFAEAQAAYQEGLAVAEREEKKAPGSPGALVDRALSLAKIADMLARQGKSAEALGIHRSALALREKLVAREPDNLAWQLALVESLRDTGITLTDLNDVPASAESLARAREILGRLAATASDAEARALAGAELTLSAAFFDRHKRMKDRPNFLTALELARHAYETRNRLTAAALAAVGTGLDDGNIRCEEAEACDAFGDLLLYRGSDAERDVDEGLRIYEHGLAVAAALVKEDSSNSLWQRTLSDCYYNLGLARRAKGEPAEAVAALREAVAIREHLVQQAPTFEWRLGLATACEGVASLEEKLQADPAPMRARARAVADELLALYHPPETPRPPPRLARLLERLNAKPTPPPAAGVTPTETGDASAPPLKELNLK